MNLEFSWGWFLGGIALVVIGTLIVVYHQKIADNLAGGVTSYGKVKLFGVIAAILGMLFITNLHKLLLYGIFHLIAPTVFP